MTKYRIVRISKIQSYHGKKDCVSTWYEIQKKRLWWWHSPRDMPFSHIMAYCSSPYKYKTYDVAESALKNYLSDRELRVNTEYSLEVQPIKGFITK